METAKAPWYYLLLLILAGESVFILPFVLSRVFRPTVLEAFDLTNTELGLCFSVYGLVALIAYLLGRPPSRNPKAFPWDPVPPQTRVALIIGAQNRNMVVNPQYP